MAQTPSSFSSPQAGPSTPAATQEDIDPLADIRLLLKYVARSFYEVRHILLFDQLVHKEVMKDEELAARLGVGSKEVAKAAHLLIRDQLISIYLRAEVKPGASKATQRTYYYIDYKHCVDVIKWRMWKISKVLDDKQRNVIDGQGYVCPRCKTTYSTLDISGLSMTATSFLCEICRTPLDDNDNDVEVQKNKDRMQRLNAQSVMLKKTLQKSDGAIVPAFDVAQWVAIHYPIEKVTDSAGGLAVATGGAKEAAVSVQMAKEGDAEVKRLLKEQQAEAKRQANALPVWIAQSTVSGELTGAGIKQGTIAKASSGISFLQPTVREPVDDKSAGDFDYDAYFTTLQNQTGSLLSSASSHESKLSPSHSTSTLNSPSQSCTSLNGNNPKRPRIDHDFVDEGYGSLKGSPEDNINGNRGPKKPKVEVQEAKTMVLGGKVIDISSVTEEMELAMTPDEYQIYGGLIMAS